MSDASRAGGELPHAPNAPIIVVRRPRGGHDDHHGGAWKIAYADFMTAMMALFLVLWLVNASSEETKAAVASYFNPIDLTDRNARPRGLADPTIGPADGSRESADVLYGVEPMAENPPAPETQSTPESALDSTDEAPPDTEGAETASPDREAALEPADPFAPRDPFEPDYWSRTLVDAQLVTEADAAVLSADAARIDMEAAEVGLGEAQIEADDAEKPAPAADATLAGPVSADADALTISQAEADDASEDGAFEASRAPEAFEAPPPPDLPSPPGARDRAIAAAIAAELSDALGTVSLEVVPEEGAVVIRLSDDAARPMFALGSASPRPGLATDLARVAEALAARPGAISLHGHTDARPFAGSADGNWRLSAERAGTAHSLLLAGGMDAARVVAISAHADRDPRDEKNPLSAANRRIELRLLTGREGGTTSPSGAGVSADNDDEDVVSDGSATR